jgi:hypothetical protein
MDTTMRWRTRAAAAVVGGAVAAVLGAGGASGAAPPSEKIFSRTQTWTCDGGLGVFEVGYFPPGQDPAPVWLSRDGSRQDAVLATLLGGDVVLTFGTQEPITFSRPVHGLRRGVVTTTCSVWAEVGVAGTDTYESISGTAVIAVVGTVGPPA